MKQYAPAMSLNVLDYIIILLSEMHNNIQIGITNHAHLIHSDVENSIYQLFDDCIVDEAHRLPDYALNQVTNESKLC